MARVGGLGLSSRKSLSVKSRTDVSFGYGEPQSDDDTKSRPRRRGRPLHSAATLRKCILIMRTNANVLNRFCFSLLIVVALGIWYYFSPLGEHKHFRPRANRAQFLRKGALGWPFRGNDSKPLAVRDYISDDGSAHVTERIDSHRVWNPSGRTVEVMTENPSRRKERKLSKRYREQLREPIDDDSCEAAADWQKNHYPSCSKVHEVDLSDLSASGRSDEKVRILSHGYFSDIFMIREYNGKLVVLRSKRYKHDFTDRNFYRYEKEGISFERLSSSEYVIDIYGMCGVTSLIEYSKEGDLGYMALNMNLTRMEKLHIAHQVARGIADTHKLSIAHTDITIWQFLLINGVFKLNDFNRARWMRVNKETNEPCGFNIKVNGGKWRAPEEYRYDVETEKVDVYSMGNIFYVLLTGKDVFEDQKSKDTKEIVLAGGRPYLNMTLSELSDPVDKTLMKAIMMCHIQNPKERATAMEVANILEQEIAYHKE